MTQNRAFGLLVLLRPIQWLKNLMLFFPPFLGGALFIPQVARFQSLIPFVAFCMASSAAYILNDIIDSASDSCHPRKSKRPIPSGIVSSKLAGFLSCAFAVVALSIAWNVSNNFMLLLLSYLVVTVAYSLCLKEYALIDIFCVSAGFILRLLAGGAAFGTAISEWLFLSVFLLALFLSTGKRLAEKQSLGDGAHHHRKALVGYPPGFLESIMEMTGAAALVTYTMYVISRHSPLLVYTVPLCCFGLFRYMLRIKKGKSGDPTESLTRDFPLFVVGLAWVVMVGWGVYGQ